MCKLSTTGTENQEKSKEGSRRYREKTIITKVRKEKKDGKGEMTCLK